MHHFNIWDFISVPHDDDPDLLANRNEFSREKAEELIRKYTATWIRRPVARFFAVQLGKIEIVDDNPSSNPATQALYAQVIPAGTTSENEKRYIALMKREISDNYDDAVDFLISRMTYNRIFGWRWLAGSGDISVWLAHVHNRCNRIVDLMEKCEGDAQTTPAAANPAWIREGAMVEGGEGIGVQVDVGPNPLSYRQTAQGGLAGFRLPASSTWYLGEFAR